LRRCIRVVPALLWVIACSCSDSSGLGSETALGLPSLASPAEMTRDAALNDPGQLRLGREFRADLFHSGFTASGDSATIDAGEAAAAYGIYSFDLTDFSDEPVLHFNWASVPISGHVYIGLANWEENRWDWLGVAGNEIAIPDLENYVNSEGHFALVLAVTAGSPCTLDLLFMGIVTELPEHLTISHVEPLAGLAGSLVDFRTVHTGFAPFSYEWNFGAWATPATSTSAEPAVSVGSDAGVYTGSVTVTDRFTSQTLDFKFRVNDSDDWAHTINFDPAGDRIQQAVESRDGNLIVAGQTMLAEIASDGTVLWAWSYYPFLDMGGENTVELQLDSEGNILALMHVNSWDITNPTTLLKLDGDGNLLWKLYLGEIHDPDMAVDSDDHIICGSGAFSGEVVRVSPDGSPVWTRRYDVTGLEFFQGNSIVARPAGGAYLCQSGWLDSRGTTDLTVLCIDSDGVPVWQRAFGTDGNSEFFSDALLLPDGQLVLAGTRTSGGDPPELSNLVLACSAAGDLLYAHQWNQDGNDPHYDTPLLGPAPGGFLVAHSDLGNPQWPHRLRVSALSDAGLPTAAWTLQGDQIKSLDAVLFDGTGALLLCGYAGDPLLELVPTNETFTTTSLDELNLSASSSLIPDSREPTVPGGEPIMVEPRFNQHTQHYYALIMRVSEP
jgi:hypothetical protein